MWSEHGQRACFASIRYYSSLIDSNATTSTQAIRGMSRSGTTRWSVPRPSRPGRGACVVGARAGRAGRHGASRERAEPWGRTGRPSGSYAPAAREPGRPDVSHSYGGTKRARAASIRSHTGFSFQGLFHCAALLMSCSAPCSTP
ncbi:hypothetical protein ATKI12_1892 [Kitasatospora sp. Ki12]